MIRFDTCAAVCADPYRHWSLWRPLHEALGLTPGDPVPVRLRPENAALRALTSARRTPQARYPLPPWDGPSYDSDVYAEREAREWREHLTATR